MHRFRKAWRVGLACSAAVASLAWTPPSAAAKIACVGDSITYGYGLATPDTQSYPAALQQLLGSTQHTVGNFGVNSSTLLKAGDVPYWQQASFAASDGFKPNLVVIMLGTNDSKPQNWAHKQLFATDYAALIQHYRALGAAVYVAAPPPVYANGAFSISPSVLNDEIVPLTHQIAADADVPLIDVHTALSGKGELFADNVHPNVEGAHLIAEAVQSALEATQFGAGATPAASASEVTLPADPTSALPLASVSAATSASSGRPSASSSAVASAVAMTTAASLMPVGSGAVTDGAVTSAGTSSGTVDPSMPAAISPSSVAGASSSAAGAAASPLGPTAGSAATAPERMAQAKRAGCAVVYGARTASGPGWKLTGLLVALFTWIRRDCFCKFGRRCV